ncbi:MAG TPA: DNA mismatch repair protein MutS, partial [Rectinemataceae bacterium]|nr:DNA mismatch repair protein MutS [Rectinemataceae bacterium]
MTERSPMMDQYRRIKARYRDAVLFFRLGDFYEMFFEDAVEVSALLDLTLTQRQGEPMCGIPYHAAKPYISRLLKHGKKIAVCEQLGEAKAGKGIVDRDVVEVVTPGTTVEEDFLEQGSNNYIVAICLVRQRLCVAYLDLSTGEFRAHSREAAARESAARESAARESAARESAEDVGEVAALAEFLRSELYRLGPREALVQQSLLELGPVAQALSETEGLMVNRYPDWSFDAERSARDLERRFGLASLKGYGFPDDAPELAAAGALLRYVDETAKASTPHLSPPLPYREDEFVGIDEGSRKNLELVRNLSDSGTAYTLLSVLDATHTAPGARLLRQWLLQPLHSRTGIEARLDAVDFLYRDQRLLSSLRDILASVRDIERLASRVAMDKAHAKDLLALRLSIVSCLAARALLEARGAPELLSARAPEAALRLVDGIAQRIEAAIRDEPSILLTEGGLIRDGYDAELDRLRSLSAHSREVLEAYVEEERAASGIAALRVRYNKIIGYYIEVSKGKLDAVPPHFIRRQSLVTGERYTTTRLAELESEINGATERIVELERSLFLSLRGSVKEAVPAMLSLGRAAAVQDCLASFAWTATARGYTRPKMAEAPVLRIVEGRHPVVEAHLRDGAFVPNGLDLDASAAPPAPEAPPAPAQSATAGGPRDASFALITGPNMAGKSTYLRQTALIALMAHSGSFVPAFEAEIGLVDKIFCRVGAQDNLARGESTFLVEMHETAYILNTATRASLVVMDEVGRGTSTLDGLAIAWAVAERLLDQTACRTLFATHYHELTALEHPRLKNLSLSVLEEEGEVVFLKRIESGPAKSSYG